MNLPLPPPLKIVNFIPSSDIYTGWEFSSEINGSAKNNGIISFNQTIVEAAHLPTEEGYRLLFATGMPNIRTQNDPIFSGEDRIRAFSGLNLADPILFWSLYKEVGQMNLRYLHDTYEVRYIEALRRTLRRKSTGVRYSITLKQHTEGDFWWSDLRSLADDCQLSHAAMHLLS